MAINEDDVSVEQDADSTQPEALTPTTLLDGSGEVSEGSDLKPVDDSVELMEAEESLEVESSIVSVLTKRFNDLSATIEGKRRIWVQTPRRRFLELMTYLHDEMGFLSLCTITGLDMGDQFQLIYHLAHDNGVVLNVKQNAPRSQPQFDTVSDIYKGGVLYELEARNLLGLNIKGIPEDIAYPLPDNWPARSYPLRKDWQAPSEKGQSSDRSTDGQRGRKSTRTQRNAAALERRNAARSTRTEKDGD